MEEALDAIAGSGLASESSSGSRLVQPVNLREPPGWTDADRARMRHVVLLDARDVSASAARHAARTVDVVRDLGVVDGPVESVVRRHVDTLSDMTAEHSGATCAVVSSGEATVRVHGSGSGGRNQHLALLALLDVRDRHVGLADFAILSAGTDGVDGNSSAAGAVVIPGHADSASSLGLDAATSLASFDSARFFAPLGAQIECGPTGTNVRDLRVFIGVGG
jgi:glycerate-2-kinase